MKKNSDGTVIVPRSLTADILAMFEHSQALAADALTAANMSEAIAYASAARAMESAARRERSRIGYSAARLPLRKGNV